MNREDVKKINILLYIIMGLVLFNLVLFTFSGCEKKHPKEDYDVSMMREVSVDDTLKLFNKNDKFVLYIGRNSCDICYELLPKLQTLQKENNYITQYLDLSKVDRSGSNWEKLIRLLDIKTTNIVVEDGKEKEVNETFGYFLDKKGFTPCVIIISNGKMVAGFFGDKDEVTFEDWLHNNGI